MNTAHPPSLFKRIFLPGFAFKAVVIGGGYATGRELAEFFLPAGPWGGLLGMILAMFLWSAICAITFLLARYTRSQEYGTFFRMLLGRASILFDIAYLAMVLLMLSVFGAAAGAIGKALLGWPEVVGCLILIASIAGVAAFGHEAVERLFKYVTFFLYGVYALFLCLALTHFAPEIQTSFHRYPVLPDWAAGGLTYTGYNIIGAVVVLPVLRHLTSDRDAVVAGLLCGPFGMLPAIAFFVAMAAFYPSIMATALPSDFLLSRLNLPAFRVLFQIMIFAALLESGTGAVHAVNERVAMLVKARAGTLSKQWRCALSLILLVTAIFVAAHFGLIALIARGYRTLSFVFLAIYVAPLLTFGLWQLRRRRPSTLAATSVALVCGLFLTIGISRASALDPTLADSVDFRWGVKIPLRDGVHLNATLYTPKAQPSPAPCLFTLTPYTSQRYHERGIYFAAHGYPFLTVDVRGRGNSEGEFHPMIQEARDGYDVVEWLARQPYCNGKVSMWGGSYAGYDQWVTAKEFPPHLATIVPVASPYPGFDFPMAVNIFAPYNMEWLTLTSGRTDQLSIFDDDAFWASRFRRWFESGKPLKDFDAQLGNPSPVFQEWLAHPFPDAYWDAYNPTAEQYAKLKIPILSITGSHDGDQPGALTHYKNYMANAAPEGRARHYLIIGPWDHAGTRTPKTQFGGIVVGPHALLDIPKLHVQWYDWTMRGGPKPDFLKKPLAYYVINADRWRYADSLEALTADTQALYLDSATNASDVLTAGTLDPRAPTGRPDHYIYDPHDLSTAALEATVDPNTLVDQTMIYALRGRQLVYHSGPFDHDTEISGFFRLSAWISIDQPDTDFAVSLYELREDGSSTLLATDQLRARYRESLRNPRLIRTTSPLRYDFTHFTFVSQEIKKGSRLRLVLQPLSSIYSEKNYNTGGTVAEESMQDARPVTVTLYHNRTHPSTLYVPLGRPVTSDELKPPADMFTAAQ